MTDLEKRIAELKSRSCCLVPKPEAISKNSYLLTSHEYDYCRCDIDFTIDQLQRYMKALDEATKALNFYKETRDEKSYAFGFSSNFKSKDRAEMALEEIDQILNGGAK